MAYRKKNKILNREVDKSGFTTYSDVYKIINDNVDDIAVNLKDILDDKASLTFGLSTALKPTRPLWAIVICAIILLAAIVLFIVLFLRRRSERVTEKSKEKKSLSSLKKKFDAETSLKKEKK